MMDVNDSLKISQNEDGTFSMEWDKEDPKWKWLNGGLIQQLDTRFHRIAFAD